MKVLYKGFAGERAQTRQIIFNQALSLEDIIAVSGEKAPYIEQQEEKDYRKQQLKQQRREEVMARKKKVTDPSVISSDLNNLNPGLLAETIDKNVINEEQVMQLQRAVGADLLQYALSQCGDQPTLEQVQTKLKALLS